MAAKVKKAAKVKAFRGTATVTVKAAPGTSGKAVASAINAALTRVGDDLQFGKAKVQAQAPRGRRTKGDVPRSTPAATIPMTTPTA